MEDWSDGVLEWWSTAGLKLCRIQLLVRKNSSVISKERSE